MYVFESMLLWLLIKTTFYERYSVYWTGDVLEDVDAGDSDGWLYVGYAGLREVKRTRMGELVMIC